MISIFLGSLIFSVWMVILFWGRSIGISMLLFVVPFSYFIINILEKKNKIKYNKSKILIIPITLLSSTYFIYDNSFFRELNLFVIPAMLLLLCVNLLEKNTSLDRFLMRIVEILFFPISYIELTMKKLKTSISLKLNPDKKIEKSGVLKGIFITIPIAIIVIILLASADEVFKNIFLSILKNIAGIFGEISLVTLILKLLTISALFVYFSSFLDYLVNTFDIDEKIEKVKFNFFDKSTIKVLLVTLNIIYVIFCVIQIKSLFMKTGIDNYSSYARKGFFQLMVVSFINLLMIIISKNNEKNKNDKFVNFMCIIMIIATFIILISSAYRMYLYESVFGYTLLRLLVYCTLFAEAILLIPTIIYVLDKKINLIKVYSIILIIIYVGINFMNVDKMIAKRNVDRYIQTGKIDIIYLTNELGFDAIGEIKRISEIDAISMEEQDLKKFTERYLENTLQKLEQKEMDFRDFNISKMIARNILVEK